MSTRFCHSCKHYYAYTCLVNGISLGGLCSRVLIKYSFDLEGGFSRTFLVYIIIFTFPSETHHADDDKHTLLRQYGCLNRHPERVRDPRFVEEPFFDPRDLLQVKYECCARCAGKACRFAHGAARFGLSRPACYKAIRAFEAGGFPGLLPDKPGPRQAHKLVPDVLAFLADGARATPRRA